MFNMPLLRLETTVVLSEDKRQTLLASLCKTVAETIGKPQQYVMVAASQAAMQMSGSPAVRATRPLWMSRALEG
jgi:phenylpyruvate tautomerase PptA (4-oxalocrotonate tautomerase family)